MGMLPVLIRCFTFWIGSVLSCLGYQPKPRLAARNIHSILPLPGELPDRSRRKQDLSYHQVQTSPIDLHIRSIVVPDSSSTAVIVHCHRPPADLITSPGFPLHLSQCFLRAARLRNSRLIRTRSHHGNRKFRGYLWITNFRFKPAKSMECTLDDSSQGKSLRPVILDLHNRLEIVTNRSIPMSGHS